MDNKLQDRRRKLSDEDIIEIKELYSTGNYSMRRLGGMFNVSHMTILYIVNDESLENHRRYKKENWREWQQTTEERTEIMRRYRERKRQMSVN